MTDPVLLTLRVSEHTHAWRMSSKVCVPGSVNNVFNYSSELIWAPAPGSLPGIMGVLVRVISSRNWMVTLLKNRSVWRVEPAVARGLATLEMFFALKWRSNIVSDGACLSD